MRNLQKLLLLVTGILFSILSVAQDTKPVQLTFTADRTKDGYAIITIKAAVKDGVKLLSAKKQNADDAFISQVVFDSAFSGLLKDSLQETGNVQSAVDSASGATLRFFTDSVQWKQEFSIPDSDSAVIK